LPTTACVDHNALVKKNSSAAILVLWACAFLGACTTPRPPAAGSTQQSVLQQWGAPTARYALPDGVTRLEYASGPYGRTTWMVDVDRDGRVQQSRQVLNEAEFLRVQSDTTLTREGLLRWLGTPGERRHGGWQGGEVWSWRYPTNDCLWFQSSVAADGRVTGSAYGIDPRCDTPSDPRS
jgi:hypothetical protein